MYIHTHECMICMYIYIYVYIYTCMHVCMYACMHVCMYTYAYICICMCLHVYTCVYIYINTCLWTYEILCVGIHLFQVKRTNLMCSKACVSRTAVERSSGSPSSCFPPVAFHTGFLGSPPLRKALISRSRPRVKLLLLIGGLHWLIDWVGEWLLDGWIDRLVDW